MEQWELYGDCMQFSLGKWWETMLMFSDKATGDFDQLPMLPEEAPPSRVDEKLLCTYMYIYMCTDRYITVFL